MNKEQYNPESKRKFKGKLDNFDNKQERNFEKKHLKAYLRGDKYFFYGKDAFGNPIKHEVQQEWIEPEIIQSND